MKADKIDGDSPQPLDGENGNESENEKATGNRARPGGTPGEDLRVCQQVADDKIKVVEKVIEAVSYSVSNYSGAQSCIGWSRGHSGGSRHWYHRKRPGMGRQGYNKRSG